MCKGYVSISKHHDTIKTAMPFNVGSPTVGMTTRLHGDPQLLPVVERRHVEGLDGVVRILNFAVRVSVVGGKQNRPHPMQGMFSSPIHPSRQPHGHVTSTIDGRNRRETEETGEDSRGLPLPSTACYGTHGHGCTNSSQRVG